MRKWRVVYDYSSSCISFIHVDKGEFRFDPAKQSVADFVEETAKSISPGLHYWDPSITELINEIWVRRLELDGHMSKMEQRRINVSWSRWSTEMSWYVYPCVYGYISCRCMGAADELRWMPGETIEEFLNKADALAYRDDLYETDELWHEAKNDLIGILWDHRDEVMEWLNKFSKEKANEA